MSFRILREKLIEGKVENFLDLLFLSNLIQKNDLVKAKTVRNIFIYKNGRKVKIGRKEGVVVLKVEKVKTDLEKETIKIKGIIVEGPEEFGHKHHSITIKIGSDILIEKKHFEKEKIEKLAKIFSPKKYLKGQKKFLEELFIRLNKNDEKIAIGKEIEKFAEYGAIEILIISKDLIKEEKFVKIVEKVIEKDGKIVVVEKKDETSIQFIKSIKLAGFLRFRF